MTTGGLPQPPMRPTLTREYIAATALALIDADGLRKFSMRRLGTAVGFDAMAIYRYFDDQESLFDGIAEALFDEIDIDSLPWDTTWQQLAEQYCRRLRDTLLRHPHAVTIFATRPIRSPASIDAGVRMLTKLSDVGLAPTTALQILRCLREFTIGHTLSVVVVKDAAQRRSRKPQAGSADYNLLAQAADATTLDDHFDVGLTALLHGFNRA